MEDVGIFYGHLVYLTAFWYTYLLAILIYFSVSVCRTKKNLATLQTLLGFPCPPGKAHFPRELSMPSQCFISSESKSVVLNV
jgi:hypothetical protein